MVTFRRSPSGKAVDGEYHEQRRKARLTANTIGAFSDEEISRFDLETAGITGRDNPRTYHLDPAIDVFGSAKIDIRNLEDR